MGGESGEFGEEGLEEGAGGLVLRGAPKLVESVAYEGGHGNRRGGRG